MCFVSDRRTSSPGPEAGISPCCSYLAGKRPYTQSHPHWQPDEQSSAEHEDSKRPTRFAAKKRGGSNDRQWDPRWCNGYRASLVCIRKKNRLKRKVEKGFLQMSFLWWVLLATRLSCFTSALPLGLSSSASPATAAQHAPKVTRGRHLWWEPFP